MNKTPLRVLLIEDDEDDFVLVRDLLGEIAAQSYDLDWIQNYGAALETLCSQEHDVCLLDYRLGDRDGLELLQKARAGGCTTPVIFLTGQEDYLVDVEAMRAGAMDYLGKGEISARLLERSIRYAIERRRVEEQLQDSIAKLCQTQQSLRESEHQLRDLSFKLLHVQEEERTRLAQQLHDSIAQTLAAIKLRVEYVPLTKNGDEEGLTKWLDPLRGILQDAIKEVRDLYMDLRPTVLDDFGIGAALGWLVTEFKGFCPQIRVEKQIEVNEQNISNSLKVTIYRVVQEAFRNLAEHSHASKALLSLMEKDGKVELAVEDDGQGFDVQEMFSSDYCRKGLGLASMKERVRFSGGSFSVESNLATGTRIHATWPSEAA